MLRTVQNTRFYKYLKIYVLLQNERKERMRKKMMPYFLIFGGKQLSRNLCVCRGEKSLMIRAQQLPDTPPLPNNFFILLLTSAMNYVYVTYENRRNGAHNKMCIHLRTTIIIIICSLKSTG